MDYVKFCSSKDWTERLTTQYFQFIIFIEKKKKKKMDVPPLKWAVLKA